LSILYQIEATELMNYNSWRL